MSAARRARLKAGARGLEERLRQVKKERGWNTADLEENCGAGRSSVEKWTSASNDRLPNARYLLTLAEKHGYSVDWLLGFDVPKFRHEHEGVAAKRWASEKLAVCAALGRVLTQTFRARARLGEFDYLIPADASPEYREREMRAMREEWEFPPLVFPDPGVMPPLADRDLPGELEPVMATYVASLVPRIDATAARERIGRVARELDAAIAHGKTTDARKLLGDLVNYASFAAKPRDRRVAFAERTTDDSIANRDETGATLSNTQPQPRSGKGRRGAMRPRARKEAALGKRGGK